MGLRFRKSVKLGIFRLNFSKSGMGWSVGIPGCRKTFKANGGTRTTYSIPGTGLSYSQERGTTKKRQTKLYNRPSQSNHNSNSTPIIKNTLTDLQENEFVKRLNKVCSHNKRRKLALILFGLFGIGCFGCVSENQLYLLPSIGCVIGFIHFFKKASISLDIIMDADLAQYYNKLCDGFQYLMTIERVWEIDSYFTDCESTLSVPKYSAILGKSKIDGLETDNEFYYIETYETKAYFLPNTIMAYQNKKWISVEYRNLETMYGDIKYQEYYNIPSDTNVLSKRYEHQNKDGSPDKRFNKNALISICGYGFIGIESSNGLKLYLMTSNREKAQDFESQLSEYSNQLKLLNK